MYLSSIRRINSERGKGESMKRRVVMGLAALIGLLVLTGCGPKGNGQGYQTLLESYYGQNIDQFVDAWGPPQSQYDYSDGRRAYTFVRSSYTSGAGYPAIGIGGFIGSGGGWGGGIGFGLPMTSWPQRYYCETTVMTDRKGKIVDYSFRGNACRAEMPGGGAQGRPAVLPDDGPAWATVCGPEAPPDCGPAYPPGWGPAHTPW